MNKNSNCYVYNMSGTTTKKSKLFNLKIKLMNIFDMIYN